MAQGHVPAVQVFFQKHRQLDHLLGEQLRGRDPYQHVAGVHVRRGGQFDDGAGCQPFVNRRGQIAGGVVRLVGDHQRTMQPQQVGERETRPLAVFGLLQIGQRRPLRQGDEMRFQRLLVRVEIADVDVLHPRRRHRRHNDAGACRQFLRRELLDVVAVQHRHLPAESGIQFQPVRMAAVLEGIQRLLLDRAAGHQPHHQRAIAFQPGVRRAADEVRAHQRLAAAGGNADGHVRHVAQAGQFVAVLVAQVAIVRYLHGPGVRVRVCGEGFGNAVFARSAQEVAQLCQRLFLIVLQVHVITSPGCRWAFS